VNTAATTADRLYGCGSIDAVFPEGRGRRLVPWPAAGSTKAERRRRPQACTALVTGPPRLADLDPRTLFASQPYVLRHHVEHYLTGLWERNGTTSANQAEAANRYPLVHVDDAGHHIIFGGHHRATAALLEGRALRARIVRVDDTEAFAVLPLLFVGTTCELDHATTADPVDAVLHIASGTTVVVPDLDVARRTLETAGHRHDVIEDRLAVAAGGAARIAA